MVIASHAYCCKQLCKKPALQKGKLGLMLILRNGVVTDPSGMVGRVGENLKRQSQGATFYPCENTLGYLFMILGTYIPYCNYF